ncbi:hypothetical protein BIW11_09582 [Tropilaelaps mercedesae]|uniref:Uncharacterized protein n=1 Tax=Tropilaelaps mercedesae TaxID=418985 RepID=A0A1V9XJW1_9ACAR|nr:hypothetical protein BIW11_09582 [Tropilaelaps mercedesae]
MNVQVSISGPVFAQLLHQHAISPNNQEGLLLGEVSERRFNQINDQAAVNELNEIILKICSFVPCEAYEVYTTMLEIMGEALNAMAPNRGTQLIGYYCFRRNLPLTATFRERRIANAFARFCRGAPFVLGLFSTTFNENFSIHSMEHSFQTVTYTQDGPKLGPASLRVVNLGEDARQEYRTLPGSAASLQQGTFSKLVNNIHYSRREDNNVRVLDKLHESLQEKLLDLSREITETLQVI